MARNCIYSYAELDHLEKELEWYCKRHKNFTSAPFSIEIPIEDIKNSSRGNLISCGGVFDYLNRPFSAKEADFFVASNRWSRLLPYLSGKESINLLSSKYLSHLIPQRRGIHLVTFQNGIMNTVKEFTKKGNILNNLVMKQFPESPLCIGFHNPTTENLIGDSIRAIRRFKHKNDGFIQRVALFFEALLGIGTSINRNFRWVHFSHSEAGCIAHLAIEMVFIRQQVYRITRHHIANHLISASYGPLMPIPKHFALATFNSYSERDNATWNFGKCYYGHPAYEIELLPCESENPPNRYVPPGDHDFLGDTYQNALNRNLESISEEIGKGNL